MSDAMDSLAVAAAELAELRARARAIMSCRYLTPTARVSMLRDHEAAMVVALPRWRALSGIAPMCSHVPSTARVGRHRAW